MATLNFYLRNTKRRELPIELVFHFRGYRLRMCIGETILPSDWDYKKQQAKEKELTTKNGMVSLNSYLRAIKDHVDVVYKELPKSDPKNLEIIRSKIMDFIKPDKTPSMTKDSFYDLVERFINNEITYKGRQKADATIKTYISTKHHLKEFEKVNKYPINYDTITISFYHKFTA